MEAAVLVSLSRKLVEGVVDQLFGKLISPAKNQVSLLLHLDDEIDFLRDVLPKLKDVLLSAEVKPETEEMRRVFKEFAEDAEDILDEFDTTIAQRRLNQAEDRHLNRFHSFFKVRGCLPLSSSLGLLSLYVKIASKIKGLYGGLEKVKSDLDKRRQFMDSAEEGLLVVRGQSMEAAVLPRRPITDELLSRDFCFVGREKVKEQVIMELLEPLSKPSVVLITGMGGIGKTTLVQDIFGHDDIVQHFEFRKWICVSDELDPATVMGNILGRPKGRRMDMRSKLEGKRFLIVLDDCWRGKLSHWNDLWVPLTYGGEGSKLIITSREDVSEELEPTVVKLYKLGILSDDVCLHIFESYAGLDGAPSNSSARDGSSRLREIGRKIVNQKIRGVPLAARVLGSSLRNVSEEGAWNGVLKGVVENNIMSVLMWSYRRLPSHLKQCFAYLSLFPKDYILEREEVVLMWMAHGYVQPRDNLTLEYVGKSYFDDLVRASLIQHVYNDDDSYIMHDLVHDLAVYVSGGGYFPNNRVTAGNDTPREPEALRHLLIDIFALPDKYLGINKKLRTLINGNYYGHTDISEFQLQHVRVLSLLTRDLPVVNFNNMIYLRYLDLSKIETDILPESICGIYNLQTLSLNVNVQNFPLGTWKLPNLHRLDGGRYIRVAGIGNSSSLQTFDYDWSGRDIEELENLKELRGSLRIKHLNKVQSKQTSLKAKLNNKEYIEGLLLEWDDSTSMDEELHKDTLENLRPHENLRVLEIKRYMGYPFPSWMGGKQVLNLVKLTLSHLCYMEELPPLGQLRHLEYLYIRCLNNLRYIGYEFYGTETDVFPSLKELCLEDMVVLKEWKEYTSDKYRITSWFPSLQLLVVQHCEELRSLPRLSRHPKRLTISRTGLRVLPKIWTCSNDSSSYDLCLEELEISSSPFLYPDKWFRRYRMPFLSSLKLYNIGRCTNLVVYYSRKCLRFLSVRDMPALRSATLSNLVPTEDFREADHHGLSITLEKLHALNHVSIVNCGDAKTTVGPIILLARGCNPPSFLQEKESEFLLEEEYAIKNVVDLTTNSWKFLLKVDPRKLLKLQLYNWDLDLKVSYEDQKRLMRWFQNLSSIHRLEIWRCSLTKRSSWPPYLPLQGLCSLKSIEFFLL